MALDVQEQIEQFQEFLQNNYENKIQEILTEGKKSLIVDFKLLSSFDIELSEFLLNDPENAIKAAELSVTQMFIPEEVSLKIRFENLPESQRISIKDIRSSHLTKFLAVDGIIRQTSDVRPQITMAKFECPSCGNAISILQVETRFKEPNRCTCGRRGSFRLIHKDLVDAQRLVIEEVPERLEGGAQPKRISVFLKEDLVEPKLEKKTTPGAKVRVNGILREVPIMLKTGAQSIRYDLMIDANFVESVESTFEDVEISKEEEKLIKELAKDPLVYQRLRNSIAPSIFGHENIKDALILQLMGGVKKEKKDGTKTRGNMHMLLIGDPGSAKSTLLLSMSKVAPKARYVAGRGASSAGLTAAVVKDEFLKGWALEAGTLVLANGGYAMIDELDKISTEDTSALHEVLANEQVSISKANIQACYSEDTEVLTEVGWKKYNDVGDLKIAQYSPKDKTVRFTSHKGLYVYNYKGIMCHFKNKRIDILVTPNHRMLAREYSQKYYQVIEAKNLNYNRIKFVNSGEYISKEKPYFILPPIQHKQNRIHLKYIHQHKAKIIPMKLWLEFLGFFITEGGFERPPTIGIVQKKGFVADKIELCLRRLSKILGFTLTKMDYDPYVRFKITQTQIYEYLRRFGRLSYCKSMSLNFSELSKEQLESLYCAMMMGDGADDGGDFGSTSERLLDEFQTIAFLIGRSACKSIQYKAGMRGRREMYRVSLCDKIEPSIRRKAIKKVSYKGKVFCFSTKTGFFVTRRNGKITIQGNTLRAETTLLSAANPKLGRFDPYQPIAAQINLPPALINRFDLIFPVRDIPNKEKDEKIASHVLETMRNVERSKPEISNDFMKKYVSYARQKCKPQLTDRSILAIKTFYVNLRNSGNSGEGELAPIPISARQLEAIVRLAEASARVRLGTKVTVKDAERAINIMMACLQAVGIDPKTGKIDIDMISTGITSSTRSRIVNLREIIVNLTETKGKTIAVGDLIEEAKKKDISETEVYDLLEKLKKEGELYEPKKGFISRI